MLVPPAGGGGGRVCCGDSLLASGVAALRGPRLASQPISQRRYMGQWTMLFQDRCWTLMGADNIDLASRSHWGSERACVMSARVLSSRPGASLSALCYLAGKWLSRGLCNETDDVDKGGSQQSKKGRPVLAPPPSPHCTFAMMLQS